MKRIPKTLKVFNNFRLKIIISVYHVLCHARIIKYRCLICLAVKWLVRWVGFGWVCTQVGRIGLGEEKVTHVHLRISGQRLTLRSEGRGSTQTFKDRIGVKIKFRVTVQG